MLLIDRSPSTQLSKFVNSILAVGTLSACSFMLLVYPNAFSYPLCEVILFCTVARY